MKNYKNYIKIGKSISYYLRHNPEDLQMDKNGWVSTNDLLSKLNISFDTLNHIVKTNNKKRFVFNSDKSKIRASQGHSINVNVELKEKTPPDKLYHGTKEHNLDSIMKNGLSKMKRNHVHLSDELETAKDVGDRYKGKTVILKVDSNKMFLDGNKFYLSENGVWLTDYVEPKYLEILNI